MKKYILKKDYCNYHFNIPQETLVRYTRLINRILKVNSKLKCCNERKIKHFYI